jgi:hypothetical protein
LLKSWRSQASIAVKLLKEKENQCTTVHVIKQVKVEFRVHGFSVALGKTIRFNRYVHLNMSGLFPLGQGYKGLLLPHIFKLLVLAAELFMQIKQVNSNIVWRQKIIMRTSENKLKMNIFDRVMKAPSLCLPLLHLKLKGDAFVGQSTQIFLCGMIISRSS